MKRFLAALAAAGVLIAGGFVAATVSTPTAASAQESTDETTEEGTLVRPEKGAIMEEVFTELVADGVITQDQADEVTAALQAKHEELREQFGDRERRGHRGHGLGGFLQDALEDGVIDAAELAQLPEGHPFTDTEGPLAEYLDDGQLTEDELGQIRDQFRQNRGPRGFGGGASDEAAA